MLYLRYTHVDSASGLPVTLAPASAGPSMPEIDGLEFVFALESEYPTAVPTFYGTAPDEANINVPGVLAVLTEAEFEAARAGELAARNLMLLRQMTEVVQHYMDSVARQRNYDGIHSAALRAALPKSPFHAEGVAYGEWMDACWSYCYQVQAAVEAGTREQPTTDQLIAELPELVLPE